MVKIMMAMKIMMMMMMMMMMMIMMMIQFIYLFISLLINDNIKDWKHKHHSQRNISWIFIFNQINLFPKECAVLKIHNSVFV